MNINGIYRIHDMMGDSSSWSYVGLLRNEKKFDMGDLVFFAVGLNQIAKGEIVGVELPPKDNPEYRYKIKISDELLKSKVSEWCYTYDENFNKELGRVDLICDRIFTTLEEAKRSALQKAERMYKLQKDSIERYFKVPEPWM